MNDIGRFDELKSVDLFSESTRRGRGAVGQYVREVVRGLQEHDARGVGRVEILTGSGSAGREWERWVSGRGVAGKTFSRTNER